MMIRLVSSKGKSVGAIKLGRASRNGSREMIAIIVAQALEQHLASGDERTSGQETMSE